MTPSAHPDARATVTGIICGIGAGALWGLVFLAPALAHEWGPLHLTIGRYVCYGLAAALLIAPRWKQVTALLSGKEWRALIWLSLAGNVVYFVLLASAVQMGGIAMTSLIVGFLPLTVTIIGSRDSGAVPLGKLMPSILLCVAGALCIGWQAIAAPATGDVTRQLIGLFCAIGALLSWTAFAVGNSRWLARIGDTSAYDWNLLTGIVTGALSLLLIPAALLLERESHGQASWLMLLSVSAGVAIFASIIGNALWNRMSRLLPLTLVGQMILFETLFALIYAFIWEQRGPTLLEGVAFVLVVASVLSCIAAHRKPVVLHPEIADDHPPA